MLADRVLMSVRLKQSLKVIFIKLTPKFVQTVVLAQMLAPLKLFTLYKQLFCEE